MGKFIAIIITAPNEKEASMLSHALVDEGLIACANRFTVQSVYRWKGNIENDGEVMLVCKALASSLDAIISRVKQLHSYDVPEIIALPIVGGSSDYLDWLEESSGN